MAESNNGTATDQRPRPPGPEAPRPSATNNQKPEPKRRLPVGLGWTWTLILLAFLAANYLLAPLLFPDRPDRVTIPYTTFRQQVQAGNVAEITSQGDAVQGIFREPVT